MKTSLFIDECGFIPGWLLVLLMRKVQTRVWKKRYNPNRLYQGLALSK